jgi:hypothetical protein
MKFSPVECTKTSYQGQFRSTDVMNSSLCAHQFVKESNAGLLQVCHVEVTSYLQQLQNNSRFVLRQWGADVLPCLHEVCRAQARVRSGTSRW